MHCESTLGRIEPEGYVVCPSILARQDGRTHDISLGFDSPKSGFTVHCSADPLPVAEARLRDHCELRKYRQEAKTWFGVCLHPSDQSLRFGFSSIMSGNRTTV